MIQSISQFFSGLLKAKDAAADAAADSNADDKHKCVKNDGGCDEIRHPYKKLETDFMDRRKNNII
jgi:hypothetical protein